MINNWIFAYQFSMFQLKKTLYFRNQSKLERIAYPQQILRVVFYQDDYFLINAGNTTIYSENFYKPKNHIQESFMNVVFRLSLPPSKLSFYF